MSVYNNNDNNKKKPVKILDPSVYNYDYDYSKDRPKDYNSEEYEEIEREIEKKVNEEIRKLPDITEKEIFTIFNRENIVKNQLSTITHKDFYKHLADYIKNEIPQEKHNFKEQLESKRYGFLMTRINKILRCSSSQLDKSILSRLTPEEMELYETINHIVQEFKKKILV